MTFVIPSSTSSISLIPGCTYNTIKTNLVKCFNSNGSTQRTTHAQDCALPLSTHHRLVSNVRTFRSHHRPRFGVAAATVVDVDVPVEEADQLDSPVSGQDSGQTSKPTSTIDKSKQRSRPVRKSELQQMKDEDLVPGATFTGKVRSIQPFGAFVDFGAFTDGLVHVSQLSDGYVKDVSDVVSVGQEVKVKLVEANVETGRIALTMRENEPSKTTGQKSNPRRDHDDGRKDTKFVKGQELEGSVKNLTRSGAFINLSEGEEGFLPASEEADEGFGSIMGGGSSLEIGQEVKVRVLRIARGQVTLTMKKDDENKDFDSKLQGKVFTATNPFLVAFRNNKDIASFLDDREKIEAEDVTSSGEANKVKLVSDEKVKDEVVSSEQQLELTEETSSISSSSEQVDAPIIEETIIKDVEISEEQVEVPKVA